MFFSTRFASIFKSYIILTYIFVTQMKCLLSENSIYQVREEEMGIFS